MKFLFACARIACKRPRCDPINIRLGRRACALQRHASVPTGRNFTSSIPRRSSLSNKSYRAVTPIQLRSVSATDRILMLGNFPLEYWYSRIEDSLDLKKECVRDWKIVSITWKILKIVEKVLPSRSYLFRDKSIACEITTNFGARDFFARMLIHKGYLYTKSAKTKVPAYTRSNEWLINLNL